eukprot:4442641-Heterocapsa_arctica.AAC.1
MPMINEGGASSSADSATPLADAPPPGEAVVYLRDMMLTEKRFVRPGEAVVYLRDMMLTDE